MNQVFVLSSTKKPLMPCRPARARRLLQSGKAAVYRRTPFTIILKHRADGDTQPIRIKFDPGSKWTGIALIAQAKVIFAMNLGHRGAAIIQALLSRKAIRSGRRARKTRYREARFDNRTKPKGWLPPSLISRIDNVMTWLAKLYRLAPITLKSIESVKFDMQQIVNADISGKGYQQGTLWGYEIREYLLLKWNHTCAYCGAKGTPLQVEHILAKANGGTNRTSNLTMSCEPCNTAKGTIPVEQFLADKPKVLKKITANREASLKDAAAINIICKTLIDKLKFGSTFLETGTGGETKYNRTRQNYPKDHWVDAACVGRSGKKVTIQPGHRPLIVTAMGRGNRQVVATDKYGFPRTKTVKVMDGDDTNLIKVRVAAKSHKRIHGIATGDTVRINAPKGAYNGTRIARVSSINTTTNYIATKISGAVVWFRAEYASVLQCQDGYKYELGPALT